MSRTRTTFEMVVLATFLGAALIGHAAVLLLVTDPFMRLGVGLLLLALIMTLSAKLGVISRMSQAFARSFRRRSFIKLRGVVDQFLDEVRRLNWAVAGVERGFRQRDQALSEIDALENRLHDLVRQIRAVAGEKTPEAELGEAVPPPVGDPVQAVN